MDAVIVLDESLLIGKGYHRECYFYHKDDSLCIKVMHNHDSKAIRQLKREINYNLLLTKKKIPMGIVSRYHGKVLTNKGEGYVFDLVKDFDGYPSKALSEYIVCEDFLQDKLNEVVDCVNSLKASMLKHNIVTMKMYPNNILYQRLSEDEARLVIIDDIGTAVFIPLEYYFDFFAKMRIKRKWNEFLKTIEKKYPSSYTLKLLEAIK